MDKTNKTNIIEFAKENHHMSQFTTTTDIANLIADLKAISEKVGAVINDKTIVDFVSNIPVGYSISNPVKDFPKQCQSGVYNDLTDEQYNEKLDEIVALGILLNSDKDSDLITLDVRDAYKHLVDSVIEVQKSVKQIYDAAMLLQVMGIISEKSE